MASSVSASGHEQPPPPPPLPSLSLLLLGTVHARWCSPIVLLLLSLTAHGVELHHTTIIAVRLREIVVCGIHYIRAISARLRQEQWDILPFGAPPSLLWRGKPLLSYPFRRSSLTASYCNARRVARAHAYDTFIVGSCGRPCPEPGDG